MFHTPFIVLTHCNFVQFRSCMFHGVLTRNSRSRMDYFYIRSIRMETECTGMKRPKDTGNVLLITNAVSIEYRWNDDLSRPDLANCDSSLRFNGSMVSKRVFTRAFIPSERRVFQLVCSRPDKNRRCQLGMLQQEGGASTFHSFE